MSISYGPANPTNGNCYTAIYPRVATSANRMMDGRLFTDYRPRCLQYPLKVTGMWGEHDGRQKMVQSTDSLIDEARNLLQKKVAPVKNSCVDTMVPELYKRVCTWKGCETIPGHYAGIGTGRIYVPDSASSANDPDALAVASVPTMPDTYATKGMSESSQCAADDKEKFWKFLDQPQGYSARATPYSGPRA
jgi:hypothetical protein